MTDAEKLRLCAGCRDDFYNGQNPLGVKRCWALAKAKVVTRWRQPWWTQGDAPGAFTEVQTLSCHYEPGRFAFHDKLPDFAVAPVRKAKS